MDRFNLYTVKKLKRGDAVHLEKWQNKKDGTTRITTTENVLIDAVYPDAIVFKNRTRYTKEAKFEEYGKTWFIGPVCNSYDNI